MHDAKDDRVTLDVKNKLAARGFGSQSHLTVQTSNGLVTLSGSVQHSHQKRAAVRAITGMAGVRRVIDQTTVKAAATRQVDEHTSSNRRTEQDVGEGADISMNQELLIQQIRVESQALEHVTRALEVMLGWTVKGDGFARKLSSVRFFTELYLRHLERLFALEEIDGYMESISRLNPELTHHVDHLKEEHEQFRAAVRKSVVRIDLALPTQLAEFDATCRQLRTTINQVLEHLRRETELLVESFNCDTGGEG